MGPTEVRECHASRAGAASRRGNSRNTVTIMGLDVGGSQSRMRSTTLLLLSLLLPLAIAAPAASEDRFAEIKRLIAAEQFDGAKQALNLLPAVLRSSAEGLLLEATVQHRAGDLASSLKLVQASIERDPRNADAYVLFGLNVSRLGEPELAAEHLETATRLAPHDARAWYYYGVNRLEMKRPDEAQKSLARAVELRPDWTEARCALGLAHEQLSDFETAKKLYRDAAGREAGGAAPHVAMPYVYLGRLLLAENRPGEAVEQFAPAVRLEPESAEAWSYYGRALVDAARYEDALSALDRATQLAPDEAAAYYQRMRALKALGRTTEARVAAEEFRRRRVH